MSATALLQRLVAENAQLWVEDGDVRYRAPRGAVGEELRAALARNKGELVSLLGAECKYAAASFAQERLWFLQHLEPRSPAYNISQVLALRGRLEVSALESSFVELIGRHETLRTSFAGVGGRACQVVAPGNGFGLRSVEVASGSDDRVAIDRLIQEASDEPFDLARGPLLRATLARLSAEEHVLVVTMHHIIADGWSLALVWRELSALYAARLEGRPSPLAELPLQYADYALWQRDRLRGEVLESQLDYWRDQLADPPLLELATDRPRPAVQSYRGAEWRFELSAELTAGLRALGRREGATLFMTLLAGFQALLYRHTGQEDLCVGSPIAGRTRRETEELIGFFVNMLVLRGDLSGSPSFVELLRRVRETTLSAYAHQEVPFEKLVEMLQPERDPSRHPLFQVTLALQNAPGSGLELAGLEVSERPGATTRSRFDLELFFHESGDRVTGSAIYNPDLFDASTVGRLVSQLDCLLTDAVAGPDRRVDELEVLPPPQRHQLLVEWNDSPAGAAWEGSLHERFERQARRRPEAVAVVFEDQELTYEELDRRADRLASELRRRGVGIETRVGVCLPRSLDLVVALLGILKAGGAYVPLDPEYPEQRLTLMARDARLALVVTDRQRERHVAPAGLETLCLPEELPDEAPSRAVP